jgi:GNAT superfamily N-acetyltransferase
VYAEQRGDRGYFGLLAVDPGCQRSGFGSQLIAAAEDHCRNAGCRFMDLTFVNVRQELPGYYRRHGYVESGVLPFPPDQIPIQPVHLVQMSKTL